MSTQMEARHGLSGLHSSPGDPSRVLDEMLEQVTFSRAAELARAGQFDTAQEIIAANGKQHGLDARWLDLQARILAQKGLTSEAEACWRKALALEPGNQSCATALRRLATLKQHPVRLLFSLPLGLMFMGVVLLGALLAGINSRMDALQAQTAATLSDLQGQVDKGLTANELKPIENRQAELGRQLASVQQGVEDLSEQVRQNPAPDIPLNMDEITVTRAGGELVLSFQQGLFSEGARLTDWARATLQKLADQLEPYANGLSLTIVGHTDQLQLRAKSRYLDNYNLGLARAAGVTSFLHNVGKLPSGMFNIQSEGEHGLAQQNEAEGNGQRNRTVVIRIARLAP